MEKKELIEALEVFMDKKSDSSGLDTHLFMINNNLKDIAETLEKLEKKLGKK